MKAKKTWIVITDGARSRILFNDGPGTGVAEVEGTDVRAPHPSDRDIISDRPGRVYESATVGQHSLETGSSPKRLNKIEFVKNLAGFLQTEMAKKSFDRIIVAAAPKSLGDLRASLSKDVKEVVIGELAKDLTQIPDEEIPDHLEGLLVL